MGTVMLPVAAWVVRESALPIVSTVARLCRSCTPTPCATPVPAVKANTVLGPPVACVPCNVIRTDGNPLQLSVMFWAPLIVDVEPTAVNEDAATFPRGIEMLDVETSHVEPETEIRVAACRMAIPGGLPVVGSVVVQFTFMDGKERLPLGDVIGPVVLTNSATQVETGPE